MNLSPSSREMTLEEWAALPEDEPGELVDGHLEEEEVADLIHELVIGFFVEVLRRWLRPPRGLVATSGAKFGVAPRRGRMPDLTAFFPDAKRPPMRGLIRVPPSIALEVISPTPRDSRRDRVEKLDDYAKFGVRWYWLVDPQLRTFEIFELGADGRYVHALGASEGTVEVVPGCEGLRIELGALWSEIDACLAADAERPAEEQEPE